MARSATIQIKGLAALNRAFKRYDKQAQRGLERDLLDAANIVALDARARFSFYDLRSAAGYRPRTRGFGRIVVEQRRRKTTGQHPEYGALQMRKALVPALYSQQEPVLKRVEQMLDRIAIEEGF